MRDQTVRATVTCAPVACLLWLVVHWHCQLRRRHTGPHRYGNYTWREGAQVAYKPAEARLREVDQ